MATTRVGEPHRADAAAGVRPQPKTGGRKKRSRYGIPVPWVVATPAAFLLFAFHLAPTVMGGWYAFTDWDGLESNPNFIGLQNFREAFGSSAAGTALWNSITLAALFVILANAFGLGLALALNRAVKSRYVLRAIFFLPVLISPLVISYIWKYIFSSNGALNTLLRAVGLDSWAQPWLGDPDWAIWCVLVVMVWQFTGLAMIIYLAGLQGIPDELYEAAAIDNAGPWRQLRRITLPLLAPAFTVSIAITLIFGLRVFDQVLGLTDGGPVGASETLATQVYKQTFVFGRFGYGATLALILTVLVAVITIAQTAVLRRREARV